MHGSGDLGRLLSYSSDRQALPFAPNLSGARGINQEVS